MNWLEVGLLGVSLGFAAGWQVNDWRHESADADRAQQQKKADEAQAVRADSAAASHEGLRDQLRTEFQIIYRDRDRVVEKPVFRNVCIDADGLKLLSSAIEGQDSTGLNKVGR